jgi:hypothetical protein
MFYPPLYGGRDPGARVRATEAKTKADQALSRFDGLRQDIERLLMITEALWTLMKEEHGYTDDALVKRIEAIDLRDGRLDGKVGPTPPRHCPQCGKVRMKNRPVCLYCGGKVEPEPFER